VIKRAVTKLNGKVVSDARFKDALSVSELLDLDRDGKLDTELAFDQLGVLWKISKLQP